MLKTLTLVTAALLAATPAVAQNAAFVGPRVELNAGLRDVNRDDVNYGATVGFDVPLGTRFTAGIDGDAQNVFDRDGRELGVGARLGFAVSDNLLAFGRVGYTNLDGRFRNLEGVSYGGGLNFAMTKNLFANAEYRHTDFQRRVNTDGVRVGLGLRF